MPWFHKRFERATESTGYSAMPFKAVGPRGGELAAAFLTAHEEAIEEFRVIDNDVASTEILYRAATELD